MKPIMTTQKMNSLERKYADNLELKKLAGEIVHWRFNAIRFRIGNGAYYKPDFFIVTLEDFQLHEIKGHWREAARVRIKAAAELFPWFQWKAVTWNKLNGWQFESFNYY